MSYRRDEYLTSPRSPRRSAPDVATEVLVRERERSRSRERTPAFLRQPRPEAGPMVLSRRDVETVTRARPRSPSPVVYERRVEYVSGRSPSPPRERYYQNSSRVEVERGRGRSPSRHREVSVERTRVTRRESFSSSSISSSPSPPPVRRKKIIRRRSISPGWKEHETEITTKIVKRERSPSPPPPPPPPPEPEVVRGPTIEREVITHYTGIDHGILVARQPSPPPAPKPRSRSKHRETEIDIYTSNKDTEVDIHHSHSRERSPSRIRRARSRSRHRHVDEDALVVVDRSRLTIDHERDHDHYRSTSISRRRAHSAAPLARAYDDEATAITGKINSRGRYGEAWGGATKDWTIVDVPPGTERVRMDGVGGGSAEVDWTRYSGVRRAKFIPEREPEPTPLPPPSPRHSSNRLSVHVHDESNAIDVVKKSMNVAPRPKRDELWTEITKDLVSREALRRMGYEYEESRYLYTIMDYLRYEQVQQLIQMSEDIRRTRRLRSRHRHRDYSHGDYDVHVRSSHHHHPSPHARSSYGTRFVHEDDRYVDREVVVDRLRYH